MKLFNVIWVLGLACAVGACAKWTDQPPVQGCTVNQATGQCDTGPGPGGAGGAGGTGGTGGGVAEGCNPGTAEFTNACACCDGEAEGDPTCTDDASLVDCDYGCDALGNTFGFAIIMNAAPAAESGGNFDVTFDGRAVISEAFIAGAEDALSADLNRASINEGGTLTVTALSGATGANLDLTLEAISLDLDADSDGNTIPGPFAVPVPPETATFAGSMGDEACFNYTTPMMFTMTVNELDGAPTFIPANFVCQPVNQLDINADPVVVTPEATSGQVCLTIP